MGHGESKVLAHARTHVLAVVNQPDAVLTQMIGRADSRKLENLGGENSAGRQDDLAASRIDPVLAADPTLDRHRAVAFEPHPVDVRTGDDPKIGTAACGFRKRNPSRF